MADIIGIGGALWTAYERFIKPRREQDPKSRAMLVVNVSDDNGHFVQCVIGDAPVEREIFIETFSRSLTVLREEVSADGSTVAKAIKIEESSRWTRIKIKS